MALTDTDLCAAAPCRRGCDQSRCRRTTRGMGALFIENRAADPLGAEGAWFVQTREDLLDSGYPEPVADAYLCATFRPVHVVAQWLADLDFDGLWDLATDSGDKFLVTTWAELLDRGDVTSISRY